MYVASKEGKFDDDDVAVTADDVDDKEGGAGAELRDANEMAG